MQKDNIPDNVTSIALDDEYAKIFQYDHSLLFLYKKTERFTSALYMVTDLLPHSEPIRCRLREQGITLLSLILSFSDPTISAQLSSDPRVAAILLELTSLFDIARLSRQVSEMNSRLLKAECATLLRLVHAYEKEPTLRPEDSPLPPDFFDVQLPMGHIAHEPDIGSSKGIAPVKKRGHVGDNGNSATSQPPLIHPEGIHAPTSTVERGRKETWVSGAPLAKENTVGTARVAPREDKSVARRAVIRAVLQEQFSATIKDISRRITNCSEKTIQRELSAMVEDGYLKKLGEKRWTTYTLA